jgi:hypothetical protein
MNNSSFYCQKCSFKCTKQSDWDRHIQTIKHLNDDKNKNKCACGKIYLHSSGLCKHKKYCKELEHEVESELGSETDPESETTKKPELDVNAIVEIVKLQIQDNMELRKMLVEQSHQMMEICKNIGSANSYNNNNNMIHSNNKTFNLQFFLNEQCKNALNLTEFINSIKPTLSDLEATGELGYVEGISRVFVKELNRLDQFTRPIHCSDIKRETLYIKDDDKWEKEPKDNPKLNSAIRYVAGRNISNIGEWVQMHPGCTYSDSKYNNKYSDIVSNAMSGETESEQEKNIQKIIQNITKQVLIDKK